MDVLRGLVTVTMNGALMYVEEIRGGPRVLACTKCRTKKAMAICGDLYCRDCCISCVADYHVHCKDFSAVRLLDHRLYGCTGASVVQSGVASVAKISHISDELVNTAVLVTSMVMVVVVLATTTYMRMRTVQSATVVLFMVHHCTTITT